MLQLVVILLQLARQVFSFIEKSQLIAEGERRQVAREMALLIVAMKNAQQVRDEVEKMTDAEVDAALRGDYRDG